jgi:hypothetical protein
MDRTDENRNPIACITAVAAEAGLRLGIDYEQGNAFTENGQTYCTAKFLGDPVQTSIRVIDAVGYYTRVGTARWSYIAMPRFVWFALSPSQQRDVVGFHYQHEGGTEMRGLFPNYGKP